MAVTEAGALKDRLLHNIQQYLGNVEYVKTYAVAALLDPRFKNRHFQHPTACANAITSVSRLMEEAVRERERTPSPQPVDLPTAPADDFWGEHDNFVAAQHHATPTITIAGMHTAQRI
jgi:hypothetical protein